jgi:hypothetical protein
MCTKLGFVGSRHHHHAGEAGEIRNVERTCVGWAIGTHQSCPVDGKAHRQMLDGDVVHDLVVSALEKGRIDRGERLIPFYRQPSGEGHRVLLGNADIEAPLREDLGELVETSARRHRRSDCHDLFVRARLLDQSVCEHLSVARRRAGRGGLLRSGHDIEAARRRGTCRPRSRPVDSPSLSG